MGLGNNIMTWGHFSLKKLDQGSLFYRGQDSLRWVILILWRIGGGDRDGGVIVL